MRNRLLAIVLTAALLLSGCAQSEPTAIAESSTPADNSAQLPTDTTAEEAVPTTETTPESAQPNNAPSAVMNSITGSEINLNEVLEQDAVLWFWAPW